MKPVLTKEGKETVKDLFSGNTPLYISVVTIFEVLAKSNPNYKMGVLSGNLIILPICDQYVNLILTAHVLKNVASESGKKLSPAHLRKCPCS